MGNSSSKKKSSSANRADDAKKDSSSPDVAVQNNDLPSTIASMKSPDRPGKSRITSGIMTLPATSVCLTPHELKICRTRVLKEYALLKQHSTMPNVYIAMDPDNHLHWFCLIHSLQDSVYEGGEFVFHIALSPRYPFEAPDFYMYTPNGRFSLRTKLCFTNSSYHNENWSAIWSLQTLILGFLSFFLEKESQGAGHLNHISDEAKRQFAQNSKKYNNQHHGDILALLRQENSEMVGDNASSTEEQVEAGEGINAISAAMATAAVDLNQHQSEEGEIEKSNIIEHKDPSGHVEIDTTSLT